MKSQAFAQHLSRIASGMLPVLVFSAILVPSARAQTATPTAVVIPDDEILNEQTVEVKWQNFEPTQPPSNRVVTIRQCRDPLAETATLKDCVPLSPQFPEVFASTKPNGTGSAVYPIRTGRFNAVPAGSDTGGFLCDVENPCQLVLFRRGLNFAFSTRAPFKFGFPIDRCPVLQGGTVGGGSSAANRAINKWTADLCLPDQNPLPQVANLYAQTSSVTGIEQFVDSADGVDLDYAATSLPLTTEQNQILKDEFVGYTVVPVALSGLAFGYNFQGPQTTGKERVTDLRLSAELIAEIYAKQRSRLPGDTATDTRFKDLNPQLGPNPIEVIDQHEPIKWKRAGRSAGTWIMTSWLHSDLAAKAKWEQGGPDPGITTDDRLEGPVDDFPVEGKELVQISGDPPTGEYDLIQGADAIARKMRQASFTGISGKFNGMSWMDSSIAAFHGFPMVAVINRAGNPVKPDAESLNQAVQASLAAEAALPAAERDGFLTPVYQPDLVLYPKAYPMPTFSYLVVRTHPMIFQTKLDPDDPTKTVPDTSKPKVLDTEKVKTLKDLLTYTINGGQSSLPPCYFPLPPEMKAQAVEAMKDFDKAAPAPTTTTTTTTLPTATTTTVTALAGAISSTTTTTAPSSTTTSRPATTTSAVATTRPTTTTKPVPTTAVKAQTETDESDEDDSLGGDEEAGSDDFAAEGDFAGDAENPLLDSDQINLASEEQIGSDDAPAAVQFVRRLARALGLLEPSGARFVLPILIFICFGSLLFGSATISSTLMEGRGWNLEFRRLRRIVDTIRR